MPERSVPVLLRTLPRKAIDYCAEFCALFERFIEVELQRRDSPDTQAASEFFPHPIR